MNKKRYIVKYKRIYKTGEEIKFKVIWAVNKREVQKKFNQIIQNILFVEIITIKEF